MIFIKEEDVKKNEKNSVNYVMEYDFLDEEINLSIVRIYGRMPEQGTARNTKCKEMVYVMEGSGVIYLTDKSYGFRSGDAFLIPTNEKYYIEGNCKLVVSCTPAFTVDQHIIEEESN